MLSMLTPRTRSLVPVLVMTILGSGADAAELATCEATGRGDPNPDVTASVKDPLCALKNDFKRSCAYQELIRKERQQTNADSAKAWGERFGRVFDSEVKFDAGESAYREIQAAATRPEFLALFERWDALGRPLPSSAGYGERLGDRFSDADIATFNRAIQLIRIIDRTGAFMASVGLLAALPEEVAKRATNEERKALIAKVFSEGFAHRDAHSAGCGEFIASLEGISGGLTSFGPVYRSGDDRENFPAERKAAVEASEKSMGAFRSVAGATEKLRACGEADAAIRGAVREIQKSCDVDLPVMVFANNEAVLSDSKQRVLVDAIAKDPCYQKSVKAGLKVQKVSIATSANTLHNTKNYCKRDFAGLSSGRADTIRSAVGPYFSDPSIKYESDSAGKRGDGSSGPCAYEAKEVERTSDDTFEVEETVNGVKRVRHFFEKRVPKYATAVGEKALEGFKFARTTIYFEDRSTPIASGSSQWSAITRCKNVRFGCR